jgi:hypothetical protein
VDAAGLARLLDVVLQGYCADGGQDDHGTDDLQQRKTVVLGSANSAT